MPTLMRNTAKRFACGFRAYGTMLTSVTWPGVMEILAESGWRFVVIDAEHSIYNYESIEALLRARGSAASSRCSCSRCRLPLDLAHAPYPLLYCRDAVIVCMVS
jgi:hypothetical protein